ncbi:MAG TPA: SCO family protein [Chitinophagaceae bacterium]|nr:SCO family protein [Chitinophagaceae bacterium]
MKRKTIFYIIFFSLLVVAFYAVLIKVIPGFSKSKLPPVSYVQPFSFTNQDGRIITEKDIQGKVFLANYFFTTCKSVCPRMNNEVKKVYEHFKTENDFLILSHTSDPGTDSASRLKHYADSMQVNTSKWIFLTGRKDSLYRQARLSYRIDDPNNNVKNIEDDFLHTQFLALVNKKGEVVKIYDGLKENEVNELIKDAEILLKE